MSDYISREAAIMFAKLLVHTAYEREAKIKDCEIEKAINDIPAADVQEVKRGKWQQTTEPGGWREYECASCSVCGESFVLDEWGMDDFTSLMNYCPNCGARMEEQT